MLMTFLIIALLLFLFWPVIKAVLAVNKARNQARQMYEQAQRAAEDEARRRRPGGWSSPAGNGYDRRRQPGKKINPNEGEYVEWEDISVSSSTYTAQTDTDSGRTRFTAEEQVIDVEWEDLPPKKNEN